MSQREHIYTTFFFSFIRLFNNCYCCFNQKMPVGSSRLCMCDWEVSPVISSSCHGLRQTRIWFSLSLSGAIVHSYLQLPLFRGYMMPLFQLRKVLHTKLPFELLSWWTMRDTCSAPYIPWDAVLTKWQIILPWSIFIFV